MNDIVHHHGRSDAVALPAPRTPVSIRPATPSDLAFVDGLQKQHSKMLGFMRRTALETYIASGDVLIAETAESEGVKRASNTTAPPSPAHPLTPSPAPPQALGYCIGRDRYFKREDVGVIYQLAVTPGTRRSLIGAMLVQHMFEKAAYGCKLFCCWCAQDLEANHFWESIGFVPLAFRTGTRGRGKTSGGAGGTGGTGGAGGPRIHIFWQKRIRAGDTQTPYWFPSQTSGGAIREDRLVIPIPPGTHWSDAKPLLLPEIPGVERFVEEERKSLPEAAEDGSKGRRRKAKAPNRPRRRGLWFADEAAEAEKLAAEEKEARAPEPRTERPRKVYHPKYVAAARDLCARYLEEVQAGRFLPEAQTSGKYDVSRALPGGDEVRIESGPADGIRLLDAA